MLKLVSLDHVGDLSQEINTGRILFCSKNDYFSMHATFSSGSGHHLLTYYWRWTAGGMNFLPRLRISGKKREDLFSYV